MTRKIKIRNPEMRIRIWFERLDQRIPKKRWIGIIRSENSRGKNNSFYGKKHNNKTIEKIRSSKLGKIPWNKNITGYQTKPCSDKTKKAISEANKGKKRTERAKKQMSKSHKDRLLIYPHVMVGKHHSQKTCDKISKANKGKTAWNKGKIGIYSKESLEKMRLSKTTEEALNNMREKRKNWKIPFKDTKPERMMQIALTLNGIKFEKHKLFKIGRSWHRVDIFIEPNIIVEVDGIHWHMRQKELKRDLAQTQELTIMGYHVIRIRDKDILRNTQNCALIILKLINELKFGVKLL